MVEIVEAFLAEHLPDGKPARLGVAVSGGIDSMTLLHVVRRLASRSLFIPVVLHFDHDLRPGSDEDRKFVEKAARECGLEVHSEKRTLESREGSVEEWARKARYAFLERAARKLALDAVVTAHHADDQAETVLFRLLRGTGIRGLAGIPPVRNSGGLLILRPLLSVRRAEIIRYAEAQGVSHRDDPTNAEIVFARNRIRHQVLPFLMEHGNPQLIDGLCRTAEIIRGEDDYLEAHAAEELGKWREAGGRLERELESLRQLHPALRARVFQLVLVKFGVAPGYELLELLAGVVADEKRVSVAGELFAYVEGRFRRTFVIGHPPEVSPLVKGVFPVEENGLTRIAPLSLSVTCSLASHSPGVKEFRPRSLRVVSEGVLRDSAFFDRSAIRGGLVVRTRREGDRIRPFGMQGSKKLHDIFIDEKISLLERDRWPILCDEEGILWVIGLKQDERTRIHETTTRVLRIDVERAPVESESPDAA